MGERVTDTAENYRIVSSSLTVKAMRDSGYKNTAYALAELIDNSIDAQADLVQVFACEIPVKVATRTMHRVHEIAVLDNGSGMDSDLLRRALKYGDGQGGNRDRIGRFGMGLPNSSMSQCRNVQVWSWTNGPGNALCTYLDLEEIGNGCNDVPEPKHDPVPDEWRQLSAAQLGRTGTLVVWSDLDRVNWNGAAATLTNTEYLIGRIYRHFLCDGRVQIRMAPVRGGQVQDSAYYARPNDPLYLMADSSTPTPFDSTPMFEPFDLGNEKEPGVAPIPVDVDGQVHYVTVRASIARREARLPDVPGHPWPDGASPTAEPGSHPWGKHAMRNVGISLVRQGRELDLDASWANTYDPIERWWGIEIDFPSALDEVFGVTNNKQTATIFSSLANFDWHVEAEGGETYKAFKDRLAEIGDKRLGLIELARYINGLQSKLRSKLKIQTQGARKGRKRHGDDVASRASEVVKRRLEEGHTGETDKLEESASQEGKRREQVDSLTGQHHLDKQTAESMVDEALAKDWRVRWISSPQDSLAFFSIDLLAGMIQVIFNDRHPLHRELVTVLEEVPDQATEADLRDRLAQASRTFQLLLFSWARMEDEIPSERQRQRLADTRQDWGRYARGFLDGEDNDE